MRVLYSIALYLLTPPLLLFFWWRGRHDRGYRQRWHERFALQRIPPEAVGGIVVHAVSVGEAVAATPLILRLRNAYPDTPITVTCTTPTGSARIAANLGENVFHWYLPFDLPGANRRFLEKLQPRALIILETELWPNLLAQCRAALVPTIVANARLSAKSAKGYRRVYRFSRPMLADIDLLLAQDRATARRFDALKLRRPAQVCGNLKFEQVLSPAGAALAERIGPLLAGRTVWVAGSTHAGEDEPLIEACRRLREELPDLLLVLAPRHPDRFADVARLLDGSGLRHLRRAEMDKLDARTDVLLLDVMGELSAWYSHADLVFIGGSLIARGGHNPLEAMCFGKAIQSGRHVHNFARIYRQLEQHDAVNWVDDAPSLVQSTLTLLRDPSIRQRQEQAALELYRRQAGASACMLEAIEHHLGQAPALFRADLQPDQCLWWQRDRFETVDTGHFDPGYWQSRDAVIGHSSGRNTAWFIQHNERRMVLRHYYRGGLMARLSRDRFLRVPTLHSRAMQEFSLLQTMAARGLPVPAPCAARMSRDGLTYRADILIDLIPGSRDIFTILCETRAMTPDEWQQVGRAIARLHAEDIYHSDLNCHNILLDETGKVWLIDFDKSGPRAPGIWKQKNLDRLLRSLRKEKGKFAHFRWQENDWQELLLGYRQGG